MASAEDNPAFDVESRIDENETREKRDYLKNPLSENEVEKKLEGYIKIPKKIWHLIRRGEHIRYFAFPQNTNNKNKTKPKSEFRQGGFVVANPTTTKETDGNEPRKAISFQTQPVTIQKKGPQYRYFCVPYDTIDKIYVKITLEMALMLENNQIIVDMINENADKANDVNKKLIDKNDKLSLAIKKLSANQ